ncbi:MAG: anaerobic ribonucleoside-triphosphate reductase activating protein [DPANN group archaeon]|nr:anaerobic ribonucleoside-triphosphate reductase activating protein [DPANN group archaeon]
MHSMIKGIQKTTLVDYPGKVAATIFIAGCNMRCGFCHNRDLVVDHSGIAPIPVDEVLSFLASRKDRLDGVCITGGEPTLWPGLPDLCRRIKALGLSLKLDTNGTNPSIVKKLIDEGLLDYIAMDIKAGPDHYSLVSGVHVPLDRIRESITLLMTSGVDYEFRTTIIPDVHDRKEMESIRELIKGCRHYALQQYKGVPTTIDPKYNNMEPLSMDVLKEYKTLMEEAIPSVEIRNS